MACRPAGYSSEEDSEIDDFFFADSKPKQKVVWQPAPKTLDEQLIDAIYANDPEALGKKLDEGANIHYRSEKTGNYTPIMRAASLGNFDVLEVLVNRGANVNDNYQLYNVLMCLCNANQNENELCKCLDLLLERGADPLATDWVGATPLISAARRNRILLTSKFIECGCPINGTDGDGYTALFHAVQNNLVGMAAHLIEAGGNINLLDHYGNTMWDVASSLNNKELTDLVTPKDHFSNMEEPEGAIQKQQFVSQYKTVLTMAPKREDRFYGFHDEAVKFLEDIGIPMAAKTAQKNNVQFAELMTWDEVRWKELGITMTYNLNKIATCVQKYHEREWGKGSIPKVNDATKHDKVDLFTVVQLLFSCLETSHIASTSSLYLLSSCHDLLPPDSQTDIKKALSTLHTIKKQIKTLKRISSNLKNENLLPCDLIVKKPMETTNVFKCKYLMYGGVIFLIVLRLRRFHFNIPWASLKGAFNPQYLIN